MPKRTSLPSMLPPVSPSALSASLPCASAAVTDDGSGEEQHAHHGEDGPALPLVADHAAEHVGQRGAEREDRDDLHVIRQRGRILERMRGIGVEEAAAIGAQHLDRDLRRDRADRDGLLGAFERCRVDIGAERLRNPLPDQEQRIGNADRNEDVERAAGHIDPEISDRLRRMARKAADDSDSEHDAGRGGEKILMGQAEHLHEIGHRAFAAVVLPVGVGDEAHRRIERQIFADRGLARRIERQPRLQSHQGIKNEKAAEMEQQHADGIDEPALFAPFVDAGDLVDARSRPAAAAAKGSCARR